MKYTHPYRVGKKQNRAVLDANGLEVVIFPEGNEIFAQEFCQMLNNKSSDKYDTSIMENSQLIKHNNLKSIICAFFDVPETEYEKLQVISEATDGSKISMPASLMASHVGMIGSWAFADREKKQIHVWATEKATPSEAAYIIGHELGHNTGVYEPDDLEEERRADTYGLVARRTLNILIEQGVIVTVASLRLPEIPDGSSLP